MKQPSGPATKPAEVLIKDIRRATRRQFSAEEETRIVLDGRAWMLGGDAPTFSDITLATAVAVSKFPVCATPLDERFEHLDAFWRRWQERPAFRAAYADRSSGVPELDDRQ
ncbi:hypothetical protein ACN9MF_25210 [Methylobacterium fujisawaense]|uniref:hypothetical protein n=1 Tax=Methylobacterium fujisawaense TaxID=107400 RepID=UPI0031F59128